MSPSTPILAARRVHFVGIGGMGMSALARMLLARGVAVSGSDLADSPLLPALAAAGAHLMRGHQRGQLGGAELVVRSSAIAEDNPELQEARDRGVPVVHRSELLTALMSDRRTVAVAGTHGKSTTTAMTARILIHAGLDPSVVVGAESLELGGNWRVGGGAWFVAEADESDGSFLRSRPTVAVVTSVECDHMDYFRDEAHVIASFQQFVDQTGPGGAVVLCADDANARRLRRAPELNTYTYGFSDHAQWRLTDYEADPRGTCFSVTRGGLAQAWVRLTSAGPHNALNATAALLAGVAAGVDPQLAAEALKDYRGLKRRLEVIGCWRGTTIVDDYAHHPTEVSATLQAARERWPHLVAAFQPHRFSRTRDLAGDFGHAFAGADAVVVTDVYGAGETPLAGVSGELIAAAIARELPGLPLAYAPGRSELLTRVQALARPGGAVLFLGAGDISRWAHEWLPER